MQHKIFNFPGVGGFKGSCLKILRVSVGGATTQSIKEKSGKSFSPENLTTLYWRVGLSSTTPIPYPLYIPVFIESCMLPKINMRHSIKALADLEGEGGGNIPPPKPKKLLE